MLNQIVYYRLFHLRLFFEILSKFNIWLLVSILLVANGCSLNGYWWLLMTILLLFLSGDFINGYWWSFMAILLMVIRGYPWLLY